jgi:hypothetical protein
MVATQTEACEKDERRSDRDDKAKGFPVKKRKVVRSHPQVLSCLLDDYVAHDFLAPVDFVAALGEI